MQTNKVGLTKWAKSVPAWRPTPGIARGAAAIAGLTMLAKLLGLVRTLVFSQTIGAGCINPATVTPRLRQLAGLRS